MRRGDLPGGMRVLVAGGSRVDEPKERVLEFSKELGRSLMTAVGPKAVLITGGRGREESADQAVVRGALDVLGAEDVADRVVTFPDPEADYELAEAFAGTRIIESVGRTRQARRFEMAQAADAVVSIAGKVGVRDAVNLGLALDRPSLPLPFTGGRSKRLWRENRELYVRRMCIPKDVVEAWEDAASNPGAELTPFAPGVVEVVRKAAALECFVAMPYGDPELEDLYEKAVRPALTDAAYRAIRSDETATPGRIPEAMLGQICGAYAMVAIVSDARYARSTAGGTVDKNRPGVNPNVMYEIGYAQARKIPTILLAHSAGDLPFDLAADRTLEYSGVGWAELRQLLTASLRATRGLRP